jgi:ribonuclease P/MRP protein subunit POP5
MLFKIIGPQAFNKKEVFESIEKGVSSIFGIWGLSRLEPVLFIFVEDKQIGILRCNRDYLREMRVSLIFISEISGLAVSIHVERVSGTLKTLKTSL